MTEKKETVTMIDWLSQHATIIIFVGGFIALTGALLASHAEKKNLMELNQKNKRIAELAEELYAYSHGGDSYIYLHLTGLQRSARARAEIVHVGKYPVRDVLIEVRNWEDYAGEEELSWEDEIKRLFSRKFSAIHSQPKLALTRFPFPDESKAVTTYHINISTANASILQILQIVRIDGGWLSGYRVSMRSPSTGKPEPICEYFDPGYPMNDPGSIKSTGLPNCAPSL